MSNTLTKTAFQIGHDQKKLLNVRRTIVKHQGKLVVNSDWIKFCHLDSATTDEILEQLCRISVGDGSEETLKKMKDNLYTIQNDIIDNLITFNDLLLNDYVKIKT